METLSSRILFPSFCALAIASCATPNPYGSAIESLTEQDVNGEVETVRVWVPVGEGSVYVLSETDRAEQKHALESCLSSLAAAAQVSDQAVAAGRVMQCMAKKSWVLVTSPKFVSGT